MPIKLSREIQIIENFIFDFFVRHTASKLPSEINFNLRKTNYRNISNTNDV